MEGKYSAIYEELTRAQRMLAKAPKCLHNEEFYLKRKAELAQINEEIQQVRREICKNQKMDKKNILV